MIKKSKMGSVSELQVQIKQNRIAILNKAKETGSWEANGSILYEKGNDRNKIWPSQYDRLFGSQETITWKQVVEIYKTAFREMGEADEDDKKGIRTNFLGSILSVLAFVVAIAIVFILLLIVSTSLRSALQNSGSSRIIPILELLVLGGILYFVIKKGINQIKSIKGKARGVDAIIHNNYCLACDSFHAMEYQGSIEDGESYTNVKKRIDTTGVQYSNSGQKIGTVETTTYQYVPGKEKYYRRFYKCKYCGMEISLTDSYKEAL